MHAYADLFENPKHKHMHKFTASLQPILTEQGEKIAIKIRMPSLAKLGWNKFYTHKEAREKLT